jgi:NADH-quinone oxidoreductase subunit I
VSREKRRGIAGALGAMGSLVRGVGVTARTLVEPKVTEMYPHTEPQLSEAYASCIQFVRFDEIDSHDCIACDKCAKICPSDCIVVEATKLPGMKKQRALVFDVDYSLCSLCGLCIDVCPTLTLEWSKDFDRAHYTRDEWTHDLLLPFRDEYSDEEMAAKLLARDQRVAAEKRAAREAKKEAAEAAKARAEAAKGAENPGDTND